jgi:hypothetical protein
LQKVQDAVQPILETRGWKTSDFIPYVKEDEITFNLLVGVLYGNVIELKPSILSYFNYCAIGVVVNFIAIH